MSTGLDRKWHYPWGRAIALGLTLALTVVGVAGTPAVAVQTSQTTIVSGDPADWTPHVLDGKVNAIVQVGTRMVVGGTFTQVQEAGSNKPILNRSGIFSFDATTGKIDVGFNPSIAGETRALLSSGDGSSVFVGGTFNVVNGVTSRKLTRLNVSDGAIRAGFKSPAFNGAISDLRLIRGNLIAAGSFTSANSQTRTGLASVDAGSGTLNAFFNASLTDPRAGTMNADKMDVTPDGNRLVVIGNFSKVNGESRPQIAMFDTSGSTAQLAPWRTDFYALSSCSTAFWSYMRDIDIDPTGKYFVVTTTGAYGGPDSPCDVEARFEVASTNDNTSPTWRAYTGGDTTYAVAITGGVVYVGGHMRWMNNPFAGDAAGPGAVSRPGIAALDPRNGLPFSWNPGRARGVGVFDMLATDTGLWIGSDTDLVAGETHRKLAFFPLVGGTAFPKEDVGSLPNDTYLVGRMRPVDPSVLYRINAGGTDVASADDGPDWKAGDQGDFVNTGNNATWEPIQQLDSTVPDSPNDRAPRAIFDSERWDSGDSPEMSYQFPVAAGKNVQVRLFFANRYSGTGQAGQRVFDVSIDGSPVLDDLDIAGQYGDQTGHMESFNVVSDGSVDIDFGHVTENPLINGIEIIDRDSPGPAEGASADVVRRTYFDGQSAPDPVATVSGPEAWGESRGAMLIDDYLYAGWSDGTLTRRHFDGSTFGPANAVDLFNGSFGTDVQSVTGMAYDRIDGRMYYTMAGSNGLYWRAFNPENGLVGAARFTATGDIDSLDPSRVRGMFTSGGRLYFADKADGALRSVGFSGGVVSGPSVLSDSTADWRSRGMFIWNGKPHGGPNTSPVAIASNTCVQLSCSFSGTKSTDADGAIAGYNWDFGDGATATGPTPQHAYTAAGDYTVTLTVTDDRGAQSTTSLSVTVEDTADSQLGFRAAATYSGNTTAASVRIPDSVAPGDQLLLFASNNTGSTAGTPPGWTMVGERSYADLRTTVFARTAGNASAGTNVTVGWGAQSKTDLTLLAYSGVASVQGIETWDAAKETASGSAHTTPPLPTVSPDDWIVSYWIDKSSATTSWATPPGSHQRATQSGGGGGRLASLAADTGGPVLTDTWPGLSANANSPSAKATMWSIALAPA